MRSETSESYASLLETSESKIESSVNIKDTFKTLLDKKVDLSDEEVKKKFEKALTESFKESVDEGMFSYAYTIQVYMYM